MVAVSTAMRDVSAAPRGVSAAPRGVSAALRSMFLKLSLILYPENYQNLTM